MRGPKRGPNLACLVLYRGSSKRSGDARELSCKGVARIALRHAMPVARATLGSLRSAYLAILQRTELIFAPIHIDIPSQMPSCAVVVLADGGIDLRRLNTL